MISRAEKLRSTAPYRLGILTAAWGRPLLTVQMMHYYAGLELPGVEIVPLIVKSPEDEDPTPDVGGWYSMEMPNQPLGRKWNAGLQVLIDRLKVDAVMIIGSDDFVSLSYFHLVGSMLRTGAEVIQTRDLFIYEPPGDQVIFCESMVPGAGRVLTRSAIAKMMGKCWDDDAPGRLDSSIMRRMAQLPLRINNARDMGMRGFAIVDVKTSAGPNMWTLIPTSPNRAKLLSDDGVTYLNIRRITYLPAAQFFKDHLPQISNYRALGSGDAYAKATG